MVEDDNPPNNQTFLIVKTRSRGGKGLGRRIRKGRKRGRRKLRRSRRRRRSRNLRCRRKQSKRRRLLFWSLLRMHIHCQARAQLYNGIHYRKQRGNGENVFYLIVHPVLKLLLFLHSSALIYQYQLIIDI